MHRHHAAATLLGDLAAPPLAVTTQHGAGVVLDLRVQGPAIGPTARGDLHRVIVHHPAFVDALLPLQPPATLFVTGRLTFQITAHPDGTVERAACIDVTPRTGSVIVLTPAATAPTPLALPIVCHAPLPEPHQTPPPAPLPAASPSPVTTPPSAPVPTPSSTRAPAEPRRRRARTTSAF